MKMSIASGRLFSWSSFAQSGKMSSEMFETFRHLKKKTEEEVFVVDVMSTSVLQSISLIVIIIHNVM